MEFHATAQIEAPQRRRDLLPARGQRAFDLVVLGVAGQRLVDVHLEIQRGLMVLGMRIEGQQIVLRGPAQGLGLHGGLRTQNQTRRERRGNDPCVAFHVVLLESMTLRARAYCCGAAELAVW
jgi:hypothetical protein